MNVLELFAGAGGGIYGGMLLGHTPVCAVEIVAKNRELLLQRQRDGIMPRFPIWDDVRTFDGHPWRGVVDIVSGGFPCTDISAAGKGAGIDGENSGLWREMARIVREVRPRYVFVENSPMLLTRGLGRVLSDLASIGYDCRWACLSAADCGAPHKRDRIWILAHAMRERSGGVCASTDSHSRRGTWWNESAFRQVHWTDGANRTDAAGGSSRQKHSDATSERRRKAREHRRDEPEERTGGVCADVADSECVRRGESTEHFDQTQGPLHQTKREKSTTRIGSSRPIGREQVWPTEPGMGRVADGVANWKHRIFALGNGQVPRVHAAAWRELMA